MPASKNLVIVESPAKAKTIASYLGAGYLVKSSMGHIRDLPGKGLGVDIKNNFNPTYEADPDKKKIVAELKKAAKGSSVWLATDEDREGEAIAWHLCELLDLKPAETKRIVFHEITKDALQNAIKKPRTLDMHLVDAQQARRILDRLVGYELSPVLWKKIKTGLSAGRVQSVAVRLLVEREKEIRGFTPSASFRITATFASGSNEFEAELNKKIDKVEDASDLLKDCLSAKFQVARSTQKPGQRNPLPPFTTSTLQQEASNRLGYGVRQTMRLAQKLYEAGHITYMRTDSTNLSESSIKSMVDFVDSSLGKNYSRPTRYKTKSNSAQEAHEAIRPTNVKAESAGEDPQQQKLYQLIWRRAVASQMSPAKVENSEIRIGITGRDELFIAKGQVLVFDGFLKIYKQAKDDVILPKLSAGDVLSAKQITAKETFSKAPARYSEAQLVKKLESLGIGRPSTYAPTISTIQDRGYVEKKDTDGLEKTSRSLIASDGKIQQTEEKVSVGSDRNKLVPTELAGIVTDFLVKYFADILDYEFTAKAETELDQIAEGKMKWQTMLGRFYENFHPLVEKSADASRKEASGARELGKHPKTGQMITARFGRFGPVLQMGEAENDSQEKPKFAPLPGGLRIENVTLEQALPMFELPREVGKSESGETIIASIGRFGPYLKVGSNYISLKSRDPASISLAEAQEIIAEHSKKQAEKLIADFGQIKLLNGPYGPYAKRGKQNVRIPKDVDPKKMTKEEAQSLLDNPPKRYAGRAKKSK